MTIQHKIIWNEAKDYFFITLGLLMYTIAFTVFLMPYEIVVELFMVLLFCALTEVAPTIIMMRKAKVDNIVFFIGVRFGYESFKVPLHNKGLALQK